MTDLESLVRIGLDELADEVRPVDLRARVASTRRRRHNRIRLVALGAAAAVAASAVGVVTLWPDPGEEKPEIATRTGSWLPSRIDLATATPVVADASLRMIFQVDDEGTLRSYGLVAGSDDVVALPDLPEFGPWPTVLSADGGRALVQQHNLDDAPTLVDTRTGVAVPVPWLEHYRAAGLSPDGRSIAVATLEVMDAQSEPPLRSPWGLTVVDLQTRVTRSVVLPESLDLEGTSSGMFAMPPVWSPDGTRVFLNVTSSRAFTTTAVVSLDGTDGWAPSNGWIGGAPWSPDGTRLLVSGDAQQAYRVLVADSATATPGERLASGPTRSRDALGWSAEDRLLWFDPDLQALVETDLRGTMIDRPVPVGGDAKVVSVLLAPSDTD